MPATLNLCRIDTCLPGAEEEIDQLRTRLAPEGDVVSEAGRKKTIEVFGVPLTPVEVVKQICQNVRLQGLDAVLKYTAQLDGAQLTSDQLRVLPSELEAAHQAAEPDFLETIRRYVGV